MVSVYNIKPKFQNILRPLTNLLASGGVSANQVTISAFVLSVLTGALIYRFFAWTKLILLVLPVMLFIRMALNAIDGMLAREHNQKSRPGAILNELGDMLSDAVIYAPFLIALGVNIWCTLLVITLAVASEAVGIMGVQIGASRRYDGPMGKSDRAFWFSLIAIISVFHLFAPRVYDVIFYIIAALLIYTIFNRARRAVAEEVK